MYITYFSLRFYVLFCFVFHLFCLPCGRNFVTKTSRSRAKNILGPFPSPKTQLLKSKVVNFLSPQTLEASSTEYIVAFKESKIKEVLYLVL